MRRLAALMALLIFLVTSAVAAPLSTNRVLAIEQSSTAVAAGKATLIIGQLERAADIYSGDYQMKVAPYFFKGEKGKLAIVVSSESLAKLASGLTVEITGTATTAGKGGEARRIDATATPSDKNRGALKLWFLSGNRKMVFNTSYCFLEP